MPEMSQKIFCMIQMLFPYEILGNRISHEIKLLMNWIKADSKALQGLCVIKYYSSNKQDGWLTFILELYGTLKIITGHLFLIFTWASYIT